MEDEGKTKAELIEELRILRKEQGNRLFDQSEEKYRNLFSVMEEGMYLHEIIYNKSGQAVNYRILDINPASETLLGIKKEDALNKLATELYGTDKAPFLETYTKVVETGKSELFETYFPPMKKHFRISVFSPGKGKFATVFTDITEHKHAEKVLQESERLVRSKLEAILLPEGDLSVLELADVIDIEAVQSLMDNFYNVTGMGVGILDLKGKVLVATGWQDICTRFHRLHPETAKNCIESDIILSKGVNPGNFKKYRCKNNMWDIVTPIFIGGKHMGNIFHGQFLYEDEEPNCDIFRAQAKKYGFNEVEYLAALDCVPRRNRKFVQHAMSFYAGFANIIANLSYSNLKLARSLNRRKTAEEALQKAHDQLEGKVAERTQELENANLKLQELDRLKSMFIASMSHELRTPLNSIIGFTGIILQGMSGEINQEQRKQLSLVENSANHLLDLINDVIDISKIEADKVELYIQEFDLSALSQEIKESFAVALNKKGLALLLEKPPALLIESDERRTKQILVNFISNALKFTYKGEIEIKIAKKDKIVEVSVRDTGIGMEKEDMGKLFQSFSRIATSGRLTEGTGLGLYLSKKIARLLGGDIKAESEFGKGSAFTLTLPLKYKEAIR